MKTYIKPELNIEKLNLKEIMLESTPRDVQVFEGNIDDQVDWNDFF